MMYPGRRAGFPAMERRNGAIVLEKKTVEDVVVRGKSVLLRVDFNVPFDNTGRITDDSRIRATLPTIRYLLDQGARIIICSHLGRPGGRIVENLRIAPVGRRLAELLDRRVRVLSDTTGPIVEAAVAVMEDRDIILLENLRFSPGEEANDPVFAEALARLGEVFVNDAFGASHRLHASVVGVPAIIPSAAGLLMARELGMLGRLLVKPDRPFAAVIGGAKVSGKISLFENIIKKVDIILIGGGMTATFARTGGFRTGLSPVEEDWISPMSDLMKRAASAGVRFLLPPDVIVTDRGDGTGDSRTVFLHEIPEGRAIADIGPLAREAFSREIRNCRTVLWNGPMGQFEVPAFSAGTRSVAETMASLDAVTVIGGGSTAEAVTALGLADRMTFISTGGGASLQFLSGKALPGVDALPDK